MALWAQHHEKLLREISSEKWGAPSYHCLWFFLARVKPANLGMLVSQWQQKLPNVVENPTYALDGKQLNGASKVGPKVHLVGLYATDFGVLVACERVPEKRSELNAVPAILDAIDTNGALITMDAGFANLATLEEIRKRKADYIVTIKGNQSTLEAELTGFFQQADEAGSYASLETHSTRGKRAHGRLEERDITVSHDVDWLADVQKKDLRQWGIKTLIRIRRKTTSKDKITISNLYYVSSRCLSASQAARAIREHWEIENREHYVLDVVWGEDACLVNAGHAAQNLALLRRCARNLVATADPGRSFADARSSAQFCPDYLLGLTRSLFSKF